jgi:hypothetical protein
MSSISGIRHSIHGLRMSHLKISAVQANLSISNTSSICNFGSENQNLEFRVTNLGCYHASGIDQLINCLKTWISRYLFIEIDIYFGYFTEVEVGNWQSNQNKSQSFSNFFLRGDGLHFWDPGFVAYVIMPRYSPNSKILFHCPIRSPWSPICPQCWRD